jgi:hypothetical protein
LMGRILQDIPQKITHQTGNRNNTNRLAETVSGNDDFGGL